MATEHTVTLRLVIHDEARLIEVAKNQCEADGNCPEEIQTIQDALVELIHFGNLDAFLRFNGTESDEWGALNCGCELIRYE